MVSVVSSLSRNYQQFFTTLAVRSLTSYLTGNYLDIEHTEKVFNLLSLKIYFIFLCLFLITLRSKYLTKLNEVKVYFV